MSWVSALRFNEAGSPEIRPQVVIELGTRVHVVDVREAEEMRGPLGHIPGVSWVPFEEVRRIAEVLPADAPVVLVSRSGERAAAAARVLSEAGMTWVASMAGGMVAWRDLGFATLQEGGFERRTVETLSESARELVQDAGDAAESPPEKLTLAQIREHVGDPRSVQWVKMAAFLLHGKISCVDGRDDHGVVGTPGGDAGELLLAIAAAEALRGKPVSREGFARLMAAYLETFGHFYVHTDVASMNRLIAAMREDPELGPQLPPTSIDGLQWTRYLQRPPEQVQPLMLKHVAVAEHIGCGHLRSMFQDGEAYGARSELVGWFFEEFFRLRWKGIPEAETVVLGGGHREGAVINVRLSDEVWPFTRVPLVSPAWGATQIFVNHPDVVTFLRRQVAAFLVRRPETGLQRGDLEALCAKVAELGAQQLSATLARLAAGLPVYDVRFQEDLKLQVEAAG